LALIDEMVEHVLEIKADDENNSSGLDYISIICGFSEKLPLPATQQDELKLIASRIGRDGENGYE
jgi:hypothetical protein